MNGETPHVDVSEYARLAAKIVTIRHNMDERVQQKRRRQLQKLLSEKMM